MDRLSVLDAEFLHLEDGIAHMHIAGACVFDDPPPTAAELEALLAAKLHRLPRYRQRVRAVPFELGRPVWVDDPHFALGYHVRHTALPGRGDDAAFCTLMGRLMSQPLDRDRPLWEAWLVEGLEGGRWALVCKVHHCMVDGIAGVELLTALLDPSADVMPGPPEPWSPAPEPDGLHKVIDAWSGLAADTARLAASVPDALRRPGRTVERVRETIGGLSRLGGALGSTPPLSIEGAIGPHRSWAHASFELDGVRQIRAAFGGTVNDVVLAAVAGGYRAMLAERGDDPDTAVVRTLVPVSTRGTDGTGVPDNRVTALLYELPVDQADPVDRLGRVRREMDELKHSHMDVAGETVLQLGEFAPPIVVGQVSRLAVRAMHRIPQRSVTTVTTNVPGPQFPLYCLGREMLEYRPFVPISHGVRVGTAILSYNGALFFGVTGDLASATDVALPARAMVADLEALRARADAVTDAAEPASTPGTVRPPTR